MNCGCGWDNYGAAAFRWHIIEHLPRDIVVLGSQEAHWYSQLHPIAAYNTAPIFGRGRVDMSKYEYLDDALTQAYRQRFVAEARRRQPTLI